MLVGIIVSGISPKHAILIIPVSTLIAQHGLGTGEVLLATGLFVLISSLTVVGPTIAYAISPSKVGGVVAAAYRWMIRNVAIVSAVVLILIGWRLLSEGITNF
ncbi:MAG: GAP family protein [Thermomicrobiales bacterium]|nr:GAP family protein [Thermomicrobiales bacterium]